MFKSLVQRLSFLSSLDNCTILNDFKLKWSRSRSNGIWQILLLKLRNGIQLHKFSSVSFKASLLRTRRVLSFDYELTSSTIIPVYKNPSVTDRKSRSRMLQIGLLLSKIPWVCLSCRDFHRSFKFVLKAVWNLFFSFFLTWVSKTQPNHWTKRMANTWLAT